MWAEGKTPAYRYGEIPGAAAVSENLSCCTRTMRQRGRASIPPAEETAGKPYNHKGGKQTGCGQSDSRIVPVKAVKAAGGKPRGGKSSSHCCARQYRRGNIGHTQRWKCNGNEIGENIAVIKREPGHGLYIHRAFD